MALSRREAGIPSYSSLFAADLFLMLIRVKDRRLVDIKYLVQGCGAAIATCSTLSWRMRRRGPRLPLETDETGRGLTVVVSGNIMGINSKGAAGS